MIFEYAILRSYVGSFEHKLAWLILLGRVYLLAPLAAWTGYNLPLSGSVPLNLVDIIIILVSLYTIHTRSELIDDYRAHVVARIDKIGNE